MSNDDVQTLLVALGPGAVGLLLIIVGQFARVEPWTRRRIWFAALTFILLQAAVTTLASIVFGGGITLNKFTAVSGTGLCVDIFALVLYGSVAFRRP